MTEISRWEVLYFFFSKLTSYMNKTFKLKFGKSLQLQYVNEEKF